MTLAAANAFPIGYYTNLHRNGTGKALPDLPVIGALAERYTTLDRYLCAFAGETFPNRFYQHAGQTDRDHNSEVPSTLPTIWDQLSPIPNSNGIPTTDHGYLDDTVFVVTFEWGRLLRPRPPPRVVNATNPANLMDAGDSTTTTDGQLHPKSSSASGSPASWCPTWRRRTGSPTRARSSTARASR